MRIFAILYAAMLLGIVVLADVGVLGAVGSGVHVVPLGDKICHLVLATGLGFAAVSFPGAPVLGRWRIPSGLVFVASVALLEEISQRFIRSRSFDVLDLVADAIGLAIGTWLAHRLALASPVRDH